MRWLSMAVVGALLFSAPARADKCPNMLILLDRSGSMAGFKWTTALQSINSFVPQRQSVMRFGLTTFPSAGGDVCSGGTLLVGCQFFNADAIATALARAGQPGGYTPTAETLDQAAQLPDMQDAARRRFIILLTDGDPTCPDQNSAGSEADVQATEASLGALLAGDIKTFVIGFGQDVTPARLDRLAVAGGTARANATCADPTTPGNTIPCKYYDASDLASLNAAFDQIAALAQGELQGNSCDDSCYVIGGCPAGERCVQQVQSFDGDKYSLNLGQCLADPCVGVTCGVEQFCRDGACHNACLAPCPTGDYCQDGACVADPCANPLACACSQACAKFLVCLDGSCTDDPCRYVSCPNVAPFCDRGTCYAAAVPPALLTADAGVADGGGGGAKGGCSSAGAGVGALGALWMLALVFAALRRRPG